MIEWLKLIPILGNFLIKIKDRHEKRRLGRKLKAHKKYQLHIQKGREFFREIRTIIATSYNKTNCDYVLYLDYHNGTENSIGVPYEKFELFEYNSANVEFANFECIRGEFVQEYSILDILNDSFMHTHTADYIKMIDQKFHYMLDSRIKGMKYIVTTNLKPYNIDTGCLIFISVNKRPDHQEIINTAEKIGKLYINF